MNVARLKHVCFLLRSVVFASGNSYWRPSFRVADSRPRDVASVMQNSSEVRSCSVYKLDEEVCYTKHTGVVISLGWNTELYKYILDNIPEAKERVVDVFARSYLPWIENVVGRAIVKGGVTLDVL